MLPQLRTGFEAIAAAVESTRTIVGGPLTVTAPPSFATRWLVPRLPRFLAAHPEIEFRLASSADTVDRPSDGKTPDPLLDLRQSHSAIAIRYGIGSYPGYRVEALLTPAYVPVCSPRLIAENPLNQPADLAHHLLLHDETLPEDTHQPNWSAWLTQAGCTAVDGQRGLRFSNAELALQAALDGQGIALILQPLAQADLDAGRLVIPFPQPLASPYAYYLVMQEALAGRPSVAAFRQWLWTELQTGNCQQRPGHTSGNDL
jgi:LysR family glycine cleavage system transcriptional activator